MIYVICDHCGKLIADTQDQVNMHVHSYSPEVTGSRDGYNYHRKCFEKISEFLETEKKKADEKTRRK